MDMLEGDVELTEFELIDAQSVKGVRQGANGFPFLMMKGLGDGEAAKDWADWDAAHEGGGKGKPSAAGDSKASAADAVARARQTIADHKAGKKVSAADLKNAHEVHEAHLAHEAKLKADAKAKAAAKPAAHHAAKPAAKKGAGDDVAKGARDCPKCDKSYDADHEGSKCENCGTDLPDAPAEKSEFDREAARSLVRGIVKAADKRGKIDEEPDIAGGTAVLSQIADLIIAEAQELKAGQAGEIADIQQLACAAEMIWCWRTGEESVAAGSVMPATALMQSVAKAERWTPEQVKWVKAQIDAGGVFKLLAKDRNYSAAERKEMAGDGRALPDGSYPIADEHDLNSAAILQRSGHGDAEAAARHIGKRARELGVPNPLESGSDTSKSQIAPEVTSVDTVTQEAGGLAKAVEEAVAKAVAPLQERVKSLDAELAKVKATPVPGGLVISRNVQVKQPGAAVNEDYAAKAAYYREQASLWDSQDRATADGYRLKAREADAKAVTPTS